MKVVIDADQLVYSCGFATEGEPVENTLHTVNKAVEKILEDTKATEYEVFIGGENNFREDLAVSVGYKANRPNRKPSSYAAIREHLIKHWDAKQCHGFEADDAVSILLYEDYVSSEGDEDKAQVIVSSPDKDLNNTPGWHYNPMRRTMKWVTQLQADRHFAYQLLLGDRTDNIQGLPYVPSAEIVKFKLSKAALKGVGEATAKKIMSRTVTFEDALADVLELYTAWGREEGLTDEQIATYFTEQANLLWMIRELDEEGQPKFFKLPEELTNERPEDTGLRSSPEGTEGEATGDGGEGTGGVIPES